MKIVFVINNKNNRLEKVFPRLEQGCRKAHLGSVRFVSTLRKKHAIELAKQAAEDGCDYLVAVGGDGTLNEVVNGLLQAAIPPDTYPAIGLLPLGSANDFARTAGISNSIEALIHLIQFNTTQKIDLGKLVLQQTQEIRYFINIAGIGLGAAVVRSLNRSSSVFGPGINYLKHIIKGFLSYDKKGIRCSSNNWVWQGKLLQMAVANGRYFGNAICIAPDAELSDGQLQLAIFGDLSIWDYLRNFGNLKKGVKINLPQVSYHTIKEVSIESTGSCGIEADGEYVGLAPATLSVLPNAVHFLMSPETR